MIHRVLNIGHWTIDFLFAVRYYDIEGVLACLYEVDTPTEIIDRAMEIMESDRLNCGFTYSNSYLKRAVCVVGPTSSGEEFVNTTSHEMYHLAVAIAKEMGYDLNGEYPAYVTGDAMQSLISVICKLGCDNCHSTKAHR